MAEGVNRANQVAKGIVVAEGDREEVVAGNRFDSLSVNVT